MKLSDWVCNGIGPGQARKIDEVFRQLVLPHPGEYHEGRPPTEREYIKTSEDGFLVPLQAAGCVVQIARKERAPLVRGHVRSDHILQPLGKMDADAYVAAIYPGVRTPYLHETFFEDGDVLPFPPLRDQKIFDNEFLEKRYFFWDNSWKNVGYIPMAATLSRHGFPVTIDVGAVRDLAESVDEIRDLLKKYSGPTPVQEKFYGDLRESFRRAQAAGDFAPFWRDCVKAKGEGRLLADWVPRSDYVHSPKAMKVAQAGEYYDRTLRAAGLLWIPG